MERLCAASVVYQVFSDARGARPLHLLEFFGSMIDDALEAMREYDDDCPGLYAETREKVKALYAARAAAKLEA